MTEKLPPGTLCVVCDDLATGNHYSVPSCNGCKTFFRRAVVNNRLFTCMGNGDCPVNKGVRCACRHCRLKKCLAVGMNKQSIQNDRDRIGYTKRTRKSGRSHVQLNEHGMLQENSRFRSSNSPDPHEQDHRSSNNCDLEDIKHDFTSIDPMLERLTTLENNFTLLLSRGNIEPYASLDDALATPSRFHQPINTKVMDPIASPEMGKDSSKGPFWRTRIIALYIDWAKSFTCFRNLPHSDKIALITNHASSYMIMCEAFRTPEQIDEERIENCITGLKQSSESVSLNKLFHVKSEPLTNSPDPPMIRLPTEYGSLPADYATWIPQDYGRPMAGVEGRSSIHKFLDNKLFNDVKYSSESVQTVSQFPAGWLPTGKCLKRRDGDDKEIPTFSLSGLTPVMAAMIDYMMKPFRQLNISTTEFATLQAIMFFDPDTDGIDAASQRNVAAEQKRLLTALHKHILRTYSATVANERYANILLRIPIIRKVAAKKNESLQMIDMLNLFALNSLVRETSLGIRPSMSNTPLMDGVASGKYSADCTL